MATIVKASDLLPLARKALDEHWGYIWGASGGIHTQEAQNRLAKQREQTRKWGQRWVGQHVLDCSGLFYWSYKQNGGYMYHGSNSIWNKYTTARGELVHGKRDDGQPMKLGSAVFLVKNGNRHHVGMYVGGGKVIEAKGTYYGVVMSDATAWDEWGELVNTEYDAADTGVVVTAALPAADVVAEQITVSVPVLHSGDRCQAVKTMQRLLNGAGYNLGSVDGIWGPKTSKALTDYQASKGIKASGCNAVTWMSLLDFGVVDTDGDLEAIKDAVAGLEADAAVPDVPTMVV